MTRKWLMALVISSLTLSGACGDDDEDDTAEAGDGDGDADNGDGDGDGDAPASCSSEMYAKYKDAGFQAVTDNILANIGTVSAMEPSPIGDSFKGLTADDVARVEANLFDFLVFVYGGPNKYAGQSMEDSHKGLGITEAQYTAFVTQVIVPALSKAGVPEADISNCFAPPVTDAAFIATIVEK
jgi:hypothetical protein